MVTAVGDSPLSYQWQFNGTTLTDATAVISGSQSNILTSLQVNHTNAGAYTVVISNAYGSVTSAFATLTTGGMSNLIPAVEYQALVDLYNSTHGSSWSNASGWLAANAASWFGVYVSEGHVAVLDMPTNNLNGTLPDSLGNLSGLQAIYFSSNQIAGSLPASLWGLTDLDTLDISVNNLSGSIPDSLTNLTNLRVLFLSGNHTLSNSIPSGFGNLANLQMLWLQENRLSGSIPASFGNLTNLQTLYLFDNQLTNGIPDNLGGLSLLETLDFGANNLDGDIPPVLGNLACLRRLYLFGNHLTGRIPDSLGNLTNLQVLDLNANLLTNAIPGSLGNLASLMQLTLQENQLSRSIPGSLGNLTNLQELNLYDKLLTNNIPESLGNLASLQTLNLGSNGLSGSIPDRLASLTSLQTLYLYGNNLTGNIPNNLGNLYRLEHLSLAENQLTGEIPAKIGALTNLLGLYLYQNRLSGNIPASLGGLTQLTNLALSDNSLAGPIPPTFTNLLYLQGLSLYSNFLGGPIPDLSSLGAWGALETLDVRWNNFDLLPGGAAGNQNAQTIGRISSTLNHLYTDPQNAPSIAKEPVNQTVALGGSARFVVVSTGAPPFAFRWHFGSTSMLSATNAVLAIKDVSAQEAGTYSVIVSNAYGSATSAPVVLTISSVPSVVVSPPAHVQTSNSVMILDGFGAGSGLTDPATAIAGSYSGLFSDSNNRSGQTAGFVSVTVAKDRTFEGHLVLDGGVQTFGGAADLRGKSRFTIGRPRKTPLSAVLQFGLSGGDQINGSVTDDSTFVAQLIANRSVFGSSNAASKYGGNYTFCIGGSGDSIVAPSGGSYGWASVSPEGRVIVSGSLSDGTVFSAKGAISRNGDFPLYAGLYNGRGTLMGWLTFAGGAPTSAALDWFKRGIPAAKYYPAGFALSSLAASLSPCNSTAGTPVLGLTKASVLLYDGGLASPLTDDITLEANNLLAVTTGANDKLNLVLSTKTGLFHGKFLYPPTGETISFRGALLPAASAGYGYFLGISQSGTVVISAR